MEEQAAIKQHHGNIGPQGRHGTATHMDKEAAGTLASAAMTLVQGSGLDLVTVDAFPAIAAMTTATILAATTAASRSSCAVDGHCAAAIEIHVRHSAWHAVINLGCRCCDLGSRGHLRPPGT